MIKLGSESRVHHNDHFSDQSANALHACQSMLILVFLLQEMSEPSLKLSDFNG